MSFLRSSLRYNTSMNNIVKTIWGMISIVGNLALYAVAMLFIGPKAFMNAFLAVGIGFLFGLVMGGIVKVFFPKVWESVFPPKTSSSCNPTPTKAD